MQGTWTHGTLTPFERDADLGMKAFFADDAEMQAFAAKLQARTDAIFARPGFVGSDNEAFVPSDYRMLPTRQTSLLVDPPDGRLPVRPEALTRSAFLKDNRNDFETMSSWDRCLSRGPTLMLPAGYNNGIRIVQTSGPGAGTAGLVTIETEAVHEARVVPGSNRPHLPAQVRLWLGDPVGRWEGDTFVIDSTNFHGKGWMATDGAAGRLRGMPYSEHLHMVERLTMTSETSIRYEMTVNDPEIYTRAWTATFPLTRDDRYRMFEAACHEGNQAIALVLRGARYEERQKK